MDCGVLAAREPRKEMDETETSGSKSQDLIA